MADASRIELLNLSARTVLLEDGQLLKVTHMFVRGEETDDTDAATVCVAGPLAAGNWLIIDVRRLERVSVQ